MDIIDTLKVESIGLGGWWLSMSSWLPDMVSLFVGLATLIYLVIKIGKELRTK